MNQKSLKLGLYISIIFTPIGNLIFIPPSIIILIQYFGAVLILFGLIITPQKYLLRAIKDFNRLLLILFLLYISTIFAFWETDISPGILLNLFFPPLIVISLLSITNPISTLKKLFACYFASVLLSLLYVIGYSVGILPRTPFTYELSRLDLALVMGLDSSVEHASLHRGVAVLIGVYFIKWRNSTRDLLLTISWLALVIYHGWSLFYTGHGRAGILLTLVGFFIYLNTKGFRTTWYKIATLTLLSVSFLSLSVFNPKTLLFFFTNSGIINNLLSTFRLNELLSSGFTDQTLFSVTSGRWLKIVVAWEMIKDHPLGIGFQNFTNFFSIYAIEKGINIYTPSGIEYGEEISSATGNAYITLAVEGGIIAGMLLGLFMINTIVRGKYIVKLAKDSSYQDLSLVVFSILCGAVASSFFSGGIPFNFYKDIWWWYILSAVVLIEKDIKTRNRCRYEGK
jgi:hypothetical protein